MSYITFVKVLVVNAGAAGPGLAVIDRKTGTPAVGVIGRRGLYRTNRQIARRYDVILFTS